MKTIIIVTYDKNTRGIGTDKGVPWTNLHDDICDVPKPHIPSSQTALVMGATTFNHMGGSIEGYINIVISRFNTPGVLSCRNIQHAMSVCDIVSNIEQVVFMGGEQIYSDALQMGVDEIYAIEVDHPGEEQYTAFFPPIGPGYELSFEKQLPNRIYRIFTNI